ncbi:MAG: hypothetical protein ACP5D9_09270 [Mariniphaga sp.]
MKLFHKTLRVYFIFSVITFAVSVPLFYFLVQKLWMEDVDESLFFQKEKIVTGIILPASIQPKQQVLQKLPASTIWGFR